MSLGLRASSLGLEAPEAPKKILVLQICGYLRFQVYSSMFELFIVLLGCAMDMMFLWVSAMVCLGLMALLLGLGAPEVPFNPCPTNIQIL